MTNNTSKRFIPKLVGFLRSTSTVAKLRAIRRKLRPNPPNRYVLRDIKSAVRVLADITVAALPSKDEKVLLINEDEGFCGAVQIALQGHSVLVDKISLEELYSIKAQQLNGVGCISIGSLKSSVQLEAARFLLKKPESAHIPLEYVAVPYLENKMLLDKDGYTNADFVSPLISKYGAMPYAVYEESLLKFRPKTDIRDYFELCQIIDSLEHRNIEGNISEFGSFYGHSGYLMSRILEEVSSKKKLFMFDMFENFPEESIGVDKFWSGTHLVDFDVVKSKFNDRSNVALVKGDFTETFRNTDTGALSFAFIDCDSYRATKHILAEVWESRLSTGGIVALEDYGHAALLGNRVAVHDFFDDRRDAYTYYSQFSGFFIAVKL